MKKISIVSPVYNESGNIDLFYERLKKLEKSLNFKLEYIFVDDGSTDESVSKLDGICKKDSNSKLIRFSRNFGHQAAITAGLDFAKGDAVVIIDSDLQDPPEVIAELLKKWETGSEVINARRKSRQDSGLKIFTANAFYKILNLLIKNKIPENVGDFRLLDRKVVDVLVKLPEKDRYLRGLASWVGFKQDFIEYDRDKRYSGETHYTITKMFGLAFDAIFSFSKLPMKLAIFSAFVFMFIAGIVLVYLLFSLIMGHVVAGWASTLFIFSVLTSLQMFVMAIISEYVGRIYTQGQNRPIYIVSDKKNF